MDNLIHLGRGYMWRDVVDGIWYLNIDGVCYGTYSTYEAASQAYDNYMMYEE